MAIEMVPKLEVPEMGHILRELSPTWRIVKIQQVALFSGPVISIDFITNQQLATDCSWLSRGSSRLHRWVLPAKRGSLLFGKA